MEPEESPPVQLPVFVVRDRVLFPGGLLRLSVGKPKSVRLVESLLTKRDDHHQHQHQSNNNAGPTILLAIFTQRVGVAGEGGSDDTAAVRDQRSGSGDGGGGGSDAGGGARVLSSMCRVGCAAKVVQMGRVTGSDSFKYSVLVQGVSRIRVLSLAEDGPVLHGTVVRLHDQGSVADAEVKALSLNLREAAQALLEVLKSRSHPRAMNAREILDAVSAASPGAVADILATSLNVPTDQKQAVLEETSLEKRLRRVLELVREQTRVLSIASKIHSEVEGKLNSRHREYYLRQQLKAIRSELGEEGVSSEGDEMAALESKLEAADLPSEASKVAMRDLTRLKRMQASQPEYTVVRTYLETVSELPWNKLSKETYDIRAAQIQLDKDHYGLDKVKQRIVEYIAVRSLMADSKGSILCLVGPPGVGKTSLGRSIAAALNRKFQRLSLGGVHDEAEIRGHRRTYIGAMPGGIVRCLRRAGTRNPVLLLDEVDKIGSNIRGGDPSAALLEVLDPEQNDNFTDHYVNVPFDLSSVLFVATANKIDTIPEPLLDRLEVIRIPGYTLEEKVSIAEAYLIPKQMAQNGIGTEHMLLPRSTVLRVASSYTREAGVRQLERELAAVCRHVALKVGIWRQESDANTPSNRHPKPGTGEDLAPRPTCPTAMPFRLPPPPVRTGASSRHSGGTSWGRSRRGSSEFAGQADAAGGFDGGGVFVGSDGRPRAPVAVVAAAADDRPLHGEAGGGGMGGGTGGRREGEGEAARLGRIMGGSDGGGGAGTALSKEDEGACGGTVAGGSPFAFCASRSSDDHHHHQQRQRQQQQQQQQQQPAFARVVVTCEMLRGVLGPEMYESEVAARVAVPGTCTGLAWTPTGGELLFIECTSMPGSGGVKLTGKLGEVMQESAQIALSWIRSHEREICAQLGLGSGGGGAAGDADHSSSALGRAGGDGQDGEGFLFPPGFFSDTDLHLHVPAGGVSKDGPSAGVAIASALLSLLLGRAIDTAVAMTGEITLRGLVLPVGGVRDKVLAARRGGIRHVLLPARNRGDLDDLPREAAEGLRFTFVETVGDVLYALFPAAGDRADASPPRPPPTSRAEEAPGDEAGGGAGGGRSPGFHPARARARRGGGQGYGDAPSPQSPAGAVSVGGGTRGRGSSSADGEWVVEDVSGSMLESFL